MIVIVRGVTLTRGDLGETSNVEWTYGPIDPSAKDFVASVTAQFLQRLLFTQWPKRLSTVYPTTMNTNALRRLEECIVIMPFK